MSLVRACTFKFAICMDVRMTNYICVFLYRCLLAHLFVCLFVCLFAGLAACSLICLLSFAYVAWFVFVCFLA